KGAQLFALEHTRGGPRRAHRIERERAAVVAAAEVGTSKPKGSPEMIVAVGAGGAAREREGAEAIVGDERAGKRIGIAAGEEAELEVPFSERHPQADAVQTQRVGFGDDQPAGTDLYFLPAPERPKLAQLIFALVAVAARHRQVAALLRRARPIPRTGA